MATSWQLQTSGSTAGAVAVIAVCAANAPELERSFAKLGIPLPAAGGVALRDLLGVDTGLVARWRPETSHLMPHGGPAVVRLILSGLSAAGISESGDPKARAQFPEAASLLEARMLAALARAASPLAIDLLLDQPRRWPREMHDEDGPTQETAPQELDRLIDPPLVVAIGPANVGKSSLVNALAGRSISIVADEPGTTRDHVGVMLDFGGLIVRYIDTPGLRSGGGGIEREAVVIAGQAAEAADLILACGDITAPPVACPPKVDPIRVSLRSDLGRPEWEYDVAVSARTGAGLADLVSAVRDALVPPRALADLRPWRFWGA